MTWKMNAMRKLFHTLLIVLLMIPHLAQADSSLWDSMIWDQDNWAGDQATLNIRKTGTGTGHVTSEGLSCGIDCTKNYDFGTPVTLIAIPENGSTFSNWDGDCAGTTPICEITIDGTKDVIANFEPAICTYRIDPNSGQHNHNADTGDVTVITEPHCDWTAESNESDWLNITSGNSGQGNGTVTYSIVANPTTEIRTGTLTIVEQTFTVNQTGIDCTYSITPTNGSHQAEAGNGTVTVTAPAQCQWVAQSNTDWITIIEQVNNTVTYSITANPTTEIRSGTLTIAGQTFTVNQSGLNCTYSITPTSGSHQAEAGNGTITVTASAGCQWVAQSNTDWITVIEQANNTVTYSITANPTTEIRSGTLTIAGQTFTINQSGINCTYSITPTNGSHQAEARNGTVTVTAPAGCQWTAQSNTDWITIIEQANNIVTYSITANPTTEIRSGTLTIAGQTFTVNQSGLNCTYSIVPTSGSHQAEAGNGTITVTAPAECQWAAQSNIDWITIIEQANNTVTYSITANPTTEIRSGTLTIAGQTFTINQSGLNCTYSITPTSGSHQAEAGNGTVTVTAPAGCQWTAQSNSDWITVIEPANNTVTYSIIANPTTEIRSGTLTIAGQTFTVNQNGKGCTYSIAPTLENFGANAETDKVVNIIASPEECAWEAKSNVEWATITSEISDKGNGSITYSITANPTTENRSSMLTIAGQTLTLIQTGMNCTYSIDPIDYSHSANAEIGSVTVNTSAECSWTATSNVDWATITAGANGQSNGTVTYSILANPNSESRSGTLTIAGQTFTMNQTAIISELVPDIRVEPQELRFDNVPDTRRGVKSAKPPEIHKIFGNEALFVEDSASIEENSSEPTISRVRYANINLDAIRQADETFGTVYTEQLILKLFPDVTYTVNNSSINYRADNNYSWIGKIEGLKFGNVIFVVKNDQITGSVNVHGDVYRIRPLNNGLHAIQQIDPSGFPQEESFSTQKPILIEPEPATSQQRRKPRATNDSPIIDVMVVYTEAVANAVVDIEAEINLAIDDANIIYANSGIRQRLRLVHTQQVEYIEEDKKESLSNGTFVSADLYRLTTRYDNFMKGVHELRDKYKADLVSLWIEDRKREYCGVGWIMSLEQSEHSVYGFSVVQQYCAVSRYSFVHELGHNMGAGHDGGNNNGAYEFSHGYVYAPLDNKEGSFRTIMAYPNQCEKTYQETYYSDSEWCKRLPFFSNPDIFYKGVATGESSTADNARTLNNTADIVAAFRQTDLLTEDTQQLTIYNDGEAELVVSSISVEGNAPWVSISPTSATISPGRIVPIEVQVNYLSAPIGENASRLLINSNDPDENPYSLDIIVNRQTDTTAGVASDDYYEMDKEVLSVTASAFGSTYQATLKQGILLSEIVGSTFTLHDAVEVFGDFNNEQITTYDPETGIVQIPVAYTYLPSGEPMLFRVEMQETSPGTGIFEITRFVPIPVQAVE